MQFNILTVKNRVRNLKWTSNNSVSFKNKKIYIYIYEFLSSTRYFSSKRINFQKFLLKMLKYTNKLIFRPVHFDNNLL